MPNKVLPAPEFHVDCVMCGGTSFSATTNTLKELVEIVARHLEYDDHKEYFAKHPEAKKYQSDLEKHPVPARIILESPLFSWAILGLDPFTTIQKLAKIPPFPKIPDP